MAGIILNGSVIKGLILNGSPVTAMLNGVKVFPTEEPGPTPVPLPAYTLRLRFTEGYTPTTSKGGTLTQVSSSPNVWDWTYNVADWSYTWAYYSNLLEVIDGNTSDVTDMTSMFYGCTSLTAVPLFDTSNVTEMSYMFRNCTSLTTVPLFNTSKVTGMSDMFNNCTSLTSVPLFDTSNVTYISQMFYGCTNVESGALALYQQASSQANPPSSHIRTFMNCGRDTTAGAAELTQIPSDWK